MKLETILAKMPASTLEHFKSRQMNEPESLEKAINGLKPWVKLVLKTAVRCFGTVCFEQAALEKAALEEGISGAHVKAALAILRRQGIIFAFRKSWGEELFALPEDTLSIWHSLLFPGGLKAVEASAGREGEPFGSSGCAAYDMLLALQTAIGGVKATRQGAWPKSVLRKLESGLMVKDEDMHAAAGLRIRQEDVYGPAAAVVLDMTIRSGLMKMQGDQWITCASNVYQWLTKPLSRVQSELYRLWSDAVGADEIWEIHALTAIGQAEPGSWYQLDQLFEWLQDCGMMKRIAGTALLEFLKTRLLPLQALGWVRLSRLHGGEIAFQVPFSLNDSVCVEPGSYAGMIVQPDLELIIPPYPPLQLLWDIMQWCDPVSRGEISVYRITKDSVRRGVENGITADAMSDTLLRCSMVPVDAHVIDTIRGWAGRHGAYIRSNVTLLQLDDPTVCNYLESHADFQPLLDGRIGEGIYCVEHDILDRLTSELNRLGIATLRDRTRLLNGGTETSAPEEENSLMPPSVLVPRAQELPYAPLPLKEREPEAEWSSIPAAWWKNLGIYHHSTQRDIIRHAIEHKASVRLADGNGADWELIPLSIQEFPERWGIVGLRGKERITVRSGEWQMMKLIIPGVSE
jgi:hypothetical protein